MFACSWRILARMLRFSPEPKREVCISTDGSIRLRPARCRLGIPRRKSGCHSTNLPSFQNYSLRPFRKLSMLDSQKPEYMQHDDHVLRLAWLQHGSAERSWTSASTNGTLKRDQVKMQLERDADRHLLPVLIAGFALLFLLLL